MRIALERSNRAANAARLIAVSKGHPVSVIEAAYAVGQRDFGENYAQELAQKAAALSHLSDLHWHMIGHLQTNKVRQIAASLQCLHTVDSEKLVSELDKRLRRIRSEVPLRVLLEVNLGEETQKSGVSPDGIDNLVRACNASSMVVLVGLMTIPPQTDDPNEARHYFRRLLQLRDAHGGASALPELSMGMTQDFEEAIAEGATLVRVGTAIFGPRPSKPASLA